MKPQTTGSYTQGQAGAHRQQITILGGSRKSSLFYSRFQFELLIPADVLTLSCPSWMKSTEIADFILAITHLESGLKSPPEETLQIKLSQTLSLEAEQHFVK